MNIQELLLKSFASEPCDTELAEVLKMYSEDLDLFLTSLAFRGTHFRKLSHSCESHSFFPLPSPNEKHEA